MKPVRSFLAVEITDEVREQAARLIERLAATSAKVKWVEPHNLHLTMKFLGDVELEGVPEICRAAAEAAGELPPFGIEVKGAGAFPNPGKPRTVWLGVEEGDEPMIALHDALDKKLKRLGFRPEHRRFTPHMTMGRVRGVGPAVAELGRLVKQEAAFTAGRMRVEEVVLFSSELTAEGPLYSVLGRASLGG